VEPLDTLAGMTDVPNPSPTGWDAQVGIEFQDAGGDEVRATVAVADRHLQPAGLVHGGVYAAIAESMTSYGTWLGVGGDKLVSGLSNHASFLRPAFDGDTLTAVAVPRHRGRTTWVWEVEIAGSAGKPCALVRVTIAVREPRD
jgi:uncharacterized protein (TIGR00369 family)